jgi:hypothetical protein
MCVSREKLRHSSLYVAQMVQIKWGGLSHHAKHTFMQMWGETCYLRVFDVGGLLWTNACQGYFFFFSMKSCHECACEKIRVASRQRLALKMLREGQRRLE